MPPSSTNGRALALAGLALGALVTLACTAEEPLRDRGPDAGSPSPDGGPTTTPDASPPVTPGVRSFDVELRLTVDPSDPNAASGTPAPTKQSFTLLLDNSTSEPFALLDRSVVPLTTADGRSFNARDPFTLERPGGACGPQSTTYSQLTFTVTAAGLSGRGAGRVRIITGDTARDVTVTVTLEGVNDRTAPGFPPFEGTTSDPLDSRSFSSTEPLPVGSTARLVSTTGHTIPLHPIQPDLQIPGGSSLAGAVLGFYLGVAPRYGESYRMVADGVADFAGNPLDPAFTPSFTTASPPMLLAENGFESGAATGNQGEIFEGTAAKAAISGRRSLYLSATGPATFRLSVQPGDTVVRFSVRVLSGHADVAYGSVSARVGAVGAPLALPTNIRPLLPSSSWRPSPDGRELFAGDIDRQTIPLPSGTPDEVVFQIQVYSSGCYQGLPDAQGLILDDVRVE